VTRELPCSEWPRQANKYLVSDTYGEVEEMVCLVDFKAAQLALKPTAVLNLASFGRSKTNGSTAITQIEDMIDFHQSPASKLILDAIRGRLQAVRESTELSRSKLENKKHLLGHSIAVFQHLGTKTSVNTLLPQNLIPVFDKPASISDKTDVSDSDKLPISLEWIGFYVDSPSEVLVQCQLRNFGSPPIVILGAILTGSTVSLKVETKPTTISGSKTQIIELIIHGEYAAAGGLSPTIQLEIFPSGAGVGSSLKGRRLFTAGQVEIRPENLLSNLTARVPPLWKCSSLDW
jgi:hypothetical protein